MSQETTEISDGSEKNVNQVSLKGKMKAEISGTSENAKREEKRTSPRVTTTTSIKKSIEMQVAQED